MAGRPTAPWSAEQRLSGATIRLVIVEDHLMVLQALTQALEAEPGLEVIGTAVSLHELEALFTGSPLHPHVVVMDRRLPDGSGIDGCRLVRARWPGARILMLSGAGGPEQVFEAIEAGADGYLLKTTGVATLVGAIRAAAAGEMLLTPEFLGAVARRLARRPAEQVLTSPLTPRELTVLRLLSFGRSTRGIADELDLSQGTVRVHVEAIRRKFHVTTKLEAVSAAIRHRIVDVPAT
ncbi:MAG: response regulator transcription factor [Chloroflexota bacterium]